MPAGSLAGEQRARQGSASISALRTAGRRRRRWRRHEPPSRTPPRSTSPPAPGRHRGRSAKLGGVSHGDSVAGKDLPSRRARARPAPSDGAEVPDSWGGGHDPGRPAGRSGLRSGPAPAVTRSGRLTGLRARGQCVVGHHRRAGTDPAGGGRLPGRRPRAVRGHPRRGQDGAGQGPGPGHRRLVRPGAGHARPAAVRPHRRHGVRRRHARSGRSTPGPLFNNVVLVDELNRATPRTQSSLLEAMAERQVTVDGTTHRAARPVLRGRHPEPAGRRPRHLPARRRPARPVRRCRCRWACPAGTPSCGCCRAPVASGRSTASTPVADLDTWRQPPRGLDGVYLHPVVAVLRPRRDRRRAPPGRRAAAAVDPGRAR